MWLMLLINLPDSIHLRKEAGKDGNTVSDLAGKVRGIENKSLGQERVAGVKESWKSYTCVSAYYLEKGFIWCMIFSIK